MAALAVRPRVHCLGSHNTPCHGARWRYRRVPTMASRTIATGGYVPWFDHGLPHDVSYENFLYYVERLKETCGLA